CGAVLSGPRPIMATETPNLTLPIDAVTPAASAAEDEALWYKDAVIYQAHVKSFFDANNDGIGDFAGLTQKLDYLQSLGVTCLWLLTPRDRKSTRLNSSHLGISYAVFCLKKKNHVPPAQRHHLHAA